MPRKTSGVCRAKMPCRKLLERHVGQQEEDGAHHDPQHEQAVALRELCRGRARDGCGRGVAFGRRLVVGHGGHRVPPVGLGEDGLEHGVRRERAGEVSGDDAVLEDEQAVADGGEVLDLRGHEEHGGTVPGGEAGRLEERGAGADVDGLGGLLEGEQPWLARAATCRT